jgi:hypothetical protein
MNKPNHTTGPWLLEYDMSLVMAGQVVGQVPSPDNASKAERIANARLIAAAPELLDALIRAKNELEWAVKQIKFAATPTTIHTALIDIRKIITKVVSNE